MNELCVTQKKLQIYDMGIPPLIFPIEPNGKDD